MKLIAVFLLAQLFLPHAQQEEKLSIWEAKYKHEKAILAIPGVKRVSIGGVGDKYHLIVSVDSEETAEKVKKITGSSIEGWPVHFSVSKIKPKVPKKKGIVPGCEACKCPCHRGGKTVVKPRAIDPKDPQEACDVMRRLMKKPRRKGAKSSSMCRQMVGWSNNPKVKKWLEDNGLPHWNSQEFGMPGVFAYSYIRHRLECPMKTYSYLERVKELTPKTKK